jgi:hypothetical protein
MAGGVTAPAGARQIDFLTLQYHSTAAITRVKIISDTAAKNLVVGSQLLVYKRLAS